MITEKNRDTAKLLREKRLFIFDLDGTVYLGDRIFPEAVDFIERLRESGRRVLFFTNNASHNDDFYMEKLTRAGFSPSPEEIMTSGDVTATFILKSHPDWVTYLLGSKELFEDFRARGIKMVNDEHGRVISDEPVDIVITSFDTEFDYAKLKTACDFIRAGAVYLCTHPDFNCPIDGGVLPDSGAIAAAVTASTGIAPTFFGKPSAMTAEMISHITGELRANMCIVGDRLYTDILEGQQNGITALLVLTGESTAEDAAKLPANEQPDIILPDLAAASALMFE